jgi:hypothetical protein
MLPDLGGILSGLEMAPESRDGATPRTAAILGAVALTLFLIPVFNAACGGLNRPAASHISWSPELLSAQPKGADFVMASDLFDLIDPIVGMWHVKFVVKGNNSAAPNDTEFDAGYSIWHGDVPKS